MARSLTLGKNVKEFSSTEKQMVKFDFLKCPGIIRLNPSPRDPFTDQPPADESSADHPPV
jgi:hypothetical protein